MVATEDKVRSDPAPAPGRPGILWIVLALIVLAALLVGLLLVNGLRGLAGAVPMPADVAEAFQPEPYEEIGPVVVGSIRDLAQLTTVEYVEYVMVEKGTDEGWLEWARGDSLRLFAVARIGAGVDLGELEPSDFRVTEDGVVTVTLPPARIQYVAVDNEATQILERDTGIFTGGDPLLETETRQIAETVLVDQAVAAGIIEEAEANAEVVLSKFILSLGYEDVVVDFED